MMDLNGIVGPAIGLVNPPIQVSLRRSTGYGTSASGRREPSYADPVYMYVQRQELSSPDVRYVDGLGLQGTMTSIYSPGSLAAMDRASQVGGDLLDFDGSTWLVVAVRERWADWCRVIVQKQVPTP